MFVSKRNKLLNHDRYVNRKGVALPTTSEEKKRAKRENLKQKQILIPELCDIHPFPATLWRKAVCLPCILHRINALLLADQVRRVVATEIGIGSTDLERDLNWEPLNFGWSLADVLKQTKALQKQEVTDTKNENAVELLKEEKLDTDIIETAKLKSKTNNDVTNDENDDLTGKSGAWLEIGTWSNDMACAKKELTDDLNDMEDLILSKNVTLIEKTDIKEINGWDAEIKTELKHPVSLSCLTFIFRIEAYILEKRTESLTVSHYFRFGIIHLLDA